MSVFAGVLWREWREHKGVFIWPPVVLFVLMLLVALSFSVFGEYSATEISVSKQHELQEKLGDGADSAGVVESMTALALDAAGSTDEELTYKLRRIQRAVAEPFRFVFVVVAFFVLVGSVYDERKDRSVLFWKSMPVSDLQCIAGKAVFVLWLAPIVTIIVTALAQFFVVAFSAMFVEDGMAGRVWQLSGVWSNPPQLVVQYLLFGLWALPVAGWIVLVSAFANRLPILWLVGVPWGIVLAENLVAGDSWFSRLVAGHFGMLDQWRANASGVLDQFSLLSQVGLWVGIVLGLGLLAGAVYMRRVRNEI